MLATAQVILGYNQALSASMRCLCDSGAQINLITLHCAETLKLKIYPTAEAVVGIGGQERTIGTTFARIHDRHGQDIDMPAQFIVVRSLPERIPSLPLDINVSGTIPEEDLADPTFCTPAPIDVLLGAGAWGSIIKEELRQLAGGLVAQGTRLGWTIFGNNAEEQSMLCHITQVATDERLEAALKRLWEADVIEPREHFITPAEKWCEDHFAATHYRDPTGRYVTTISIKPNAAQLGNSYNLAAQRFRSLERRFARVPEMATKYIDFMREYEALGHMRPMEPLNRSSEQHYYIPHHPVTKKFRVVFDASAKTTNGISLNDIQLPGPRIQADLCDIIIRFRSGKVGVSADVKKMYRQVRIVPEQWNLQRILWRESPDLELKEYCLTVVTYGVTSAGYNAMKAMVQCAKDQRAQYPRAEKVVCGHFYVDDLLVSMDTEEEAKLVCQEVESSLKAGGFELAKWVSNAPGILHTRATAGEKVIDEAKDVSVLGLMWDPAGDQLKFKVELSERAAPLTKRIIASDGARIFDPNGYLAPITISAKLFMQNLWRIGVEWDEVLNGEITSAWLEFYHSLKEVADIAIPRWLGIFNKAETQLHVFCDASLKAYGAVIYARTVCSEGKANLTIVTAKSKVADLQSVNIPRMELSAAHLGAKLANRVAGVLEIAKSDVYYWSDSEVVLHWIAKFPSDLKVFVGNRVGEIQALTKARNWRHVPTSQNPADLISRSATVEAVKASTLWWHGPRFLQCKKEKWPVWEKAKARISDMNEIAAEERKPTNPMQIHIVTYAGKANTPFSVMAKFRSLAKVVRITAYVKRAVATWKLRARQAAKSGNPAKVADTQQARKRKGKPTTASSPKKAMFAIHPYDVTGWEVRDTPLEERIRKLIAKIKPIDVDEYREALNYWIKKTQAAHFKTELTALRRGDPKGELLSKTKYLDGVRTGKTAKLCPFIDDKGLLRARGRLARASISYDQRHPIIIPKDSLLAQRLIREAHDRTMHGGTQICMQYVRNIYWIQGLRSMTRRHVQECIECATRRKEMGVQLMADLPSARITPSKPFHHCGVDLAGPFKLTAFKGRGTKVALTAHIVVFVCFASRAVHLEVVSELTSAAFLAALDRTVARRPNIQHIYSDNATNFVGSCE